MIELINENYTWIFSGIGVFAIGLVVTSASKRSGGKNIIKNSSTGLQAQGDIKINIKKRN